MELRFSGTVFDDEEVQLGQEVFLGIHFIVTETGVEAVDVTSVGDRCRRYAPGKKYAVLHTTGFKGR